MRGCRTTLTLLGLLALLGAGLLVGCDDDGGGAELPAVRPPSQPACEASDACSRQACFQGDVWCFDDCGQPTTRATQCAAGDLCVDAACVTDDGPPAADGAPGRSCNCDADCAASEGGHEGVCVFGVCMHVASGECSAEGSQAECPAGSRCWLLGAEGDAVCWPDCASNECSGVCDGDGACVPGPRDTCDDTCGSYCARGAIRRQVDGMPGSGCTCDTDCLSPADGFDPICVHGICALQAPEACAADGDAASCPSGSRCWPLLGDGRPVCWADCGSEQDLFACDGICDSEGSCMPRLRDECDPECGAVCEREDGAGRPGALCDCDEDCDPFDEGFDPICVQGVCMAAATEPCSEGGSRLECPPNMQCWGLNGFDDSNICWPDCDTWP